MQTPTASQEISTSQTYCTRTIRVPNGVILFPENALRGDRGPRTPGARSSLTGMHALGISVPETRKSRMHVSYERPVTVFRWRGAGAHNMAPMRTAAYCQPGGGPSGELPLQWRAPGARRAPDARQPHLWPVATWSPAGRAATSFRRVGGVAFATLVAASLGRVGAPSRARRAVAQPSVQVVVRPSRP